ncbi:ester cyclase [Halorarum halobium]|uniref:ester cyclase n=1 Tax=Halorarum halobium TaxID=3075121 RepID=UPI0028AA0B88|nr:ester cyclase [Halobaculum sp. XH14]
MTTPADHVERIERLFRGVWNGENPAVADDLVGPDYLIHDRDLAAELRGPDLYRELAAGTRAVFPDMAFTIEDTVADGDEVAVRWTMTGTHEAPAFGVEPTGRSVELTAVEINRFADGLLVETWTRSDMLGLMEQVGALQSGDE